MEREWVIFYDDDDTNAFSDNGNFDVVFQRCTNSKNTNIEREREGGRMKKTELGNLSKWTGKEWENGGNRLSFCTILHIYIVDKSGQSNCIFGW